jgi:hypothetical protein
MALLPQTLLGVLIGVLVLHGRYDALWYSHFGVDMSTLKSKVSTLQRSESAVSDDFS